MSKWIVTDQTKKPDQIDFILLRIKINLKFSEIKIDKKEFHNCKKPVDLNLVDANKIVFSDKFELGLIWKRR